MLLFKKLLFAPIFLLIFALFIFQLNSLLSSYNLIFSLSLDSLIQLVSISILILFSSFSFILFSSLSQDWRFVLPVGVVAASLPLILISHPLGIIFALGTLIAIISIYLTLEGRLKNYLTFAPTSLLGPSIRHFSTLLILIIAFTYFLSTNKIIQERGFQIPDSLIDTALKFTSPEQSEINELDQAAKPKTQQLTPEQLEMLKQNPDLLKDAGLDPAILDQIPQSETGEVPPTQEIIKQTVKNQFDSMLKPYLGLIPAALAGILFLTLLSFVSIANLLIYPLLWIIFYILEKTGFVKFTTEMRPVKKMVI